MAGNEAKALQLMAEADKKSKTSAGFFGSLFGGQQKVEDAAELYQRAANTFKMAKKWAAAGDAFEKAAKIYIKLQSNHDAATQFVDAGNCYKKSNPQDAVNSIGKAIEIYTDMGRFSMAAKHHINIAEIYETELVDIDKAIANYEQAADYYKGEESNSSANKCLLKVAHYCATLERYDKAIEYYEQIGSSCMDNQLLRYSAKDHFFRALLCHMCRDTQDAEIALKKYEDMFPAFQESRECKLVKKLFSAIEEQDVDSYSEAVREYDSISRLEQWYTTILLRIKKDLEGEEDLR